MTQPAPPPAGASLALIGPALLAAASFACADVTTKLTLQAGADALTMTLFRGFIGLPLLYAWLRVGVEAVPLTPRARWLAIGIGLLFAGNIYALFKAIEIVEVPIAILTYFVYPLLTGLAAAVTGLEKLSWRGAAAAVAAFLGLALMIGAHPGGVALAGIAFALTAAACRVVILLVTRAQLTGADPKLITWYSFLSATAFFVLAALVTLNWQVPQTPLGWFAIVGASIATTVAVFSVFVSTMRIGPFRTALFMNLEPLLATIGSALFLGEVITPLQGVRGDVVVGRVHL